MCVIHNLFGFLLEIWECEGGRDVYNSWILWVFVGNMGMRGREGGMCIIHNLSGSFLQTNKQTIPNH